MIDRCNLRCLYCMPHGLLDPFSKEELLTMEETAEIVEIFAELGITKVRLTGGEPLLRKQVPWLVRQIKKTPGIEQLVMTTNGVLLGRFAPELKDAGLDRVNISLDTLNRENFQRITGMDKFQLVLEGIYQAMRSGLKPLKINAVLMKGYNDSEVMDLVEFAVTYGCEIRFIEWMPTATEIHLTRESRYLPNTFAREKIEEKYTLVSEDADTSSPARSFRIQGTDAMVGFISPLSNAFCKN